MEHYCSKCGKWRKLFNALCQECIDNWVYRQFERGY